MTHISHLLQHDHNKQLSDYKLDQFIHSAIENLVYDEKERYTTQYMEKFVAWAEPKIQSSTEMMAIVTYFFETEGAKVFIEGGAGRGKTVLLEYMNCKYRLANPDAICQITCSTGCQTEEFQSANTLHTGYQVSIIHSFNYIFNSFISYL